MNFIMNNYRPISSVCGLTRECLIAADIETRQSRSKFLLSYSLKPEHPRSSTTDDVECFFNVLRDTVGKDFTLKQVCCIFMRVYYSTIVVHNMHVYFGWRKICMEFMKRSAPSLPFYYSTSSHQRFYEGEMPSFDEPSKEHKQKCVPQRELLGAIDRRVSLPEVVSRSDHNSIMFQLIYLLCLMHLSAQEFYKNVLSRIY